MRSRTVATAAFIICVGSIVGVTIGRGISRVAFAQDARAARHVSSTRATAQNGLPCPVIEGDTSLSIIAEDFSNSEGLGTRHGGKSSASAKFRVVGVPKGTKIPLTLTFGINYERFTETQPAAQPRQSGSIAQASVSVYLAAGGRNFVIAGNTEASRGGEAQYHGGFIPSGVASFTVPVWNNQLVTVSGLVQASAVTSTRSAVASSIISLDLLDVSFGDGASPSARNAAVRAAYGSCPDECPHLIARIEGRIAELKSRYDAMLRDENNLYCNYYYFPLYINGERIGSWRGHVQQFKEKQANLITLCNEAGNRGCFIPEDAIEWAYKEAPDHPRIQLCD